MEQLLMRVGEIIGFQPDGYVLVDLSAFEQLVDTMGGVTFNVPVDMHYSDPSQNLTIDLSAGEQHLNGEQAMQVVRFRSGYANADIGRTEVQRAVLKAAMKQWLRPQTLAALPGLWRIYKENLTTDLSARNLLWMARVLLKGMGGYALVRTRGDQRLPKGNLPNRILHTRVADAVVATNSVMARHFAEKMHVPAERLHMILGGVDTERFRFDPEGRAEVRARYAALKGEPQNG